MAGPPVLKRPRALEALLAAYARLTAATEPLGADELLAPSRGAAWAARGGLYHQLQDARRALITFATPATHGQPPDVDDVSYWRPYSPRSTEPTRLGSPGAARHAQHVRVVAAAYPPGALAQEWRETAAAAGRAAAACPYPALSTQGHVLATGDFMATLAVEAAVHYLDLTVELPSAPPPDPGPLALVRRVLDGLLGAPMTGPWDDVTYALKGTGRLPVTPADRAAIGPLADRLPLFG
jgi:hypothetical protein